MVQRSPVTFYQEIILKKCFALFDYPIHEIMPDMEGIIPECKTQNDLLNAILQGGSLAYNALIEVLKRHIDSKLYMGLRNHNIKELYRWVYIWSWSGEIMCRGTILYDNEHICRMKALSHQPNYDTYDGLGAPYAKLCVESICKCMSHLEPGHPIPREPCACFKSWEPAGCMLVCNTTGKQLVALPELLDSVTTNLLRFPPSHMMVKNQSNLTS